MDGSERDSGSAREGLKDVTNLFHRKREEKNAEDGTDRGFSSSVGTSRFDDLKGKDSSRRVRSLDQENENDPSNVRIQEKRIVCFGKVFDSENASHVRSNPNGTSTSSIGTSEEDSWNVGSELDLVCEESDAISSDSDEGNLVESRSQTIDVRPEVYPVCLSDRIKLSKKNLVEETKAYWLGGGQRLWEGKKELKLYVDDCSSKFNSATRQQLVDYVFSCAVRLHLNSATCHAAVSYLDAYLQSRNPDRFLMNWTTPYSGLHMADGKGLPAACPWDCNGNDDPPLPGKLKRLATTALFVASKVVESQYHGAAEFAEITMDDGWSVPEVCKGERGLMRELGYCLHYPSSAAFAGAYMQALQLNCSKVQLTCAYLLDAAQLTTLVLVNRASLLAAAALQLSLALHDKPYDAESSSCWSKVVGYGMNELSPLMEKLFLCLEDCKAQGGLAVNAMNKKALVCLQGLTKGV